MQKYRKVRQGFAKHEKALRSLRFFVFFAILIFTPND
jgi:hypothetical protein